MTIISTIAAKDFVAKWPQEFAEVEARLEDRRVVTSRPRRNIRGAEAIANVHSVRSMTVRPAIYVADQRDKVFEAKFNKR